MIIRDGLIKGRVKKEGDMKNIEIIEIFKGDKFDVIIELYTFVDGTKLFGVETEMNGVGDPYEFLFIGRKEAYNFAEYLI